MSAIRQHRQLDAPGSPVVEQCVDGGARRAAGVEHVVDEDDRRVLDWEVDVRGVHHWLVIGAADADVVAVEADVDVAERHRLPNKLGDQVAQPSCQDRAATMDPNDRDALPARLLDDLVCDPHQRPSHILAVENRLLTHVTAPSWPLRTRLKEPAARLAPGEDVPARMTLPGWAATVGVGDSGARTGIRADHAG